jgi:hypothetical protein
MNRYERAAQSQGFDLDLSDSPIPNPEGWHDGSVHQTGGYILVRTWRTWDGIESEHTGRDTEYECAYGQEPGVSIVELTWNSDTGFYEYADTIEEEPVPENTDLSKARTAKQLMEQFERP